MKRTTVRELHLQTSAIVRAVAEGESFIVEKSGFPSPSYLRSNRGPLVANFPTVRRLSPKCPALGIAVGFSKKIGLERIIRYSIHSEMLSQ